MLRSNDGLIQVIHLQYDTKLQVYFPVWSCDIDFWYGQTGGLFYADESQFDRIVSANTSLGFNIKEV